MRWQQWGIPPSLPPWQGWQGAGGAVTSLRGLVLTTGSDSQSQKKTRHSRENTLPQMSQVKNESQLCKMTHRRTLRLFSKTPKRSKQIRVRCTFKFVGKSETRIDILPEKETQISLHQRFDILGSGRPSAGRA